MTYLLQSVDAEPARVELHRNGYETVAALRTSFLRTSEAKALFAAANPELNLGQPDHGTAIPPFLLRRPTLPGVTYRFEEPSIAASQAGARMHHTCSQARIGRHTRQRRGHGRAGCAAD